MGISLLSFSCWIRVSAAVRISLLRSGGTAAGDVSIDTVGSGGWSCSEGSGGQGWMGCGHRVSEGQLPC